ncbi:RNA polymerase-associated protein RTF1, partial [Phenoliferia sp. Uapishka_3]
MDIDDDILALAEGTSTKRKSKSQGARGSKPKRKRPAQEDSASDMDMSSDSDALKKSRRDSPDGNATDDDGDDLDNSEFPLEGKYRDEVDRAKILAMPELDREGVLGERADKMNAALQRKELRRMVKEKDRAEGGSGGDDGARTGRDRKATGVTREKREGLEKLKKRREEKGKQKDRKFDDEPSSPRRRASPGAYSDASDSEEGEVDIYESKKSSSSVKLSKKAPGADLAGPADIKSVTVTRSRLAEFCAAPWFESWVTGKRVTGFPFAPTEGSREAIISLGAWVRYSLGFNQDKGEVVYRLCQVDGVKDFPGRAYTFEGTKNNAKSTLQLILKHGKASHHFEMSGVSDSPPTDKEFGRLASALTADDMTLPLQKEITRIKENLDRRKEYTMTEADLSAHLAKKGSSINPAQGKARLLIQRDFARQTNDAELLAQVNAQLAKFNPEAPASPSGGGNQESEANRMKKLNEKNRAQDREDIRKAETRGQDERRRQAAALARGDLGVKVDASARVKTLTRLHYDRGDTPSRPSTPLPGTPNNELAIPAVVAAKHKTTKIEEVAKSVSIDLDDLDF